MGEARVQHCPTCSTTQRWPRPRILNDDATQYVWCPDEWHSPEPAPSDHLAIARGALREIAAIAPDELSHAHSDGGYDCGEIARDALAQMEGARVQPNDDGRNDE